MSYKRKKRYEAAKILLEVSGAVSSSLDLGRVSDLVLRESVRALQADHASLFLLDDTRHLILAKAKGFSADETDNIKLLGGWEVINDHLVRKKRPLVVNDVRKNSIFRTKRLPFSREKIPMQSFMAVPLKKAGSLVGAIIVSNRERPGHIFTEEDKRLLITLSNNIAIALLNAKLYQRLKDLFINTVKSLVRAIDAKDRYTSGHSERVMKYSLAIGRELKLGDDALENLGLSSLLHDVGKIGIREDVLRKPGRLSSAERSQIRHHPLIGVNIVRDIDDSHRLARGISDHHERYDGKGYPRRLKGRSISIEGRIIAVADTYDALTTDRSYKKRHEGRTAAKVIVDNAAGQFDPGIVKAFVASFSRHADIWDARKGLSCPACNA